MSLMARRRGIISGATPPIPFEPELVTGAVACWVADDLLAVGDGNAVSSWVDRIGAFNAAQATGTKQPTYRIAGLGGQPSVEFDGSSDLLVYSATNAVSTAASGHVFAVVNADNLSVVRTIFSTSTTLTDVQWLTFDTAPLRLDVRHQNSDTLDGARVAVGNELSTATNYLVELASTGTAWEIRINNAVPTIAGVGGGNTGDWFGDTGSRSVFTIGAYKRTSELDRWDGNIAMVLVIDGAISAGDRTTLNAMIAAKYGITLA